MRKLYKEKKIVYMLYIAVISMLVSCSLGLSLGDVKIAKGVTGNGIFKFILQMKESFNTDATNSVLTLFLIVIVLFFLARREYSNRCKWCSLIFSIFSSVLLLIGRAMYKTNNLDALFESGVAACKGLIVLLGYAVVIYYVICAFQEYLLPKLTSSEFVKNYAPKKFKVTVWTCMAAILIAWLPYILVTYPCNFTPDARDQVAQYMGNEKICKTNKSVIYPEEATSLLNNHHPIVHTLIVGGFAKLGMIIGHMNVAMFLYIMLQAIFLAFAYGYTVDYLRKLGIPSIFQLIALGFFMFYPVIPMYALTVTKDSIYSGFMILVTIQFFKLIQTEEEFFSSKKEKILTFVYCLGLMLFRNNGLYILLACTVIFVIKHRKNLSRIKDIGIMIGIPIVLYAVVLLKILLPLFYIPGGSPREMLSVPFQQVARYAVEWGEDGFEPGEIEKLNKILCFDNDLEVLKERYDPLLSDPVKNEFNKYYTKEELKDFMGVWINLVKRHPGTAVMATVNNNLYYFSVDYGKHILYNGTGSPGSKFGINNPKITNAPRKGLVETIKALSKSSMLGWAFSVGTWNYMFIICILYVTFKKRYQYYIVMLPVVLNFLIGLAGPVAYMRYSIQWIVALPLFGAMVWLALQEKAAEESIIIK